MTRHLLLGTVPGFVFAAVICLALQAWGVAAVCVALAAVVARRVA